MSALFTLYSIKLFVSLQQTLAYTTTHAHANTRTREHAHAHVQVTNPLEPLMMSLVRGYVDDEDLTAKLRALYQVQRAKHRQLCGMLHKPAKRASAGPLDPYVRVGLRGHHAGEKGSKGSEKGSTREEGEKGSRGGQQPANSVLGGQPPSLPASASGGRKGMKLKPDGAVMLQPCSSVVSRGNH